MEKNYGDFVKFTEVKSIVEEIVMPIITSLRSKEQESIRTTNCINVIFKDMKEMQTITRSALLLRGNLQKVNKHVEKVD